MDLLKRMRGRNSLRSSKPVSRIGEIAMQFKTLLIGIVAALAQCLQIAPVHHHRAVAVVALDVVHHLGAAAAECTARVQTQELCAERLPFARVAALAAVRTPGIVTAAPSTDAVTLAGAEAASGHNGTT